jgi:hypothetical protein
MRWPCIVVVLVALAVPGMAEDERNHFGGEHKTVRIDIDRVTPTELTMGPGDVLEFENYAFNPMTVQFTDPANQVDKIHCRLAAHDASKPKAGEDPWIFFQFNPQGQLTAIIPPGRFASVCSLAPGRYVFVSHQAPRMTTQAPSNDLGTKGTITVQ